MIGASCLVLAIIAVLIFSILYFKKRKRWYLVALVVIILSLAYSAVDISLPKSGKVLNALDGNPISNIEVMRVYLTTNMVLNPGGESQRPKWFQSVISEDDGSYSFPISIHLKIPFLSWLSQISVGAPVCDKPSDAGRLPYCPWQFESFMSSHNIMYEQEYTTKSFVIGEDVYVIPKMPIEKCSLLIKKQLQSECQFISR